MPTPLIIFTDIHGCFNTFVKLLAKAREKLGEDGKIYILGDMIDRGPNSKQMLEWAMQNRASVTCLMGNHEHLCIDAYSNTGYYDSRSWKNNSGTFTIKSFHGRVPREIIAWMRTFPFYVIPEEYPNLLLSHTGHGLRNDGSMDSQINSLWWRDTFFPKDDGYFRIFGHTPQSQVLINQDFVNIDSGCSYGGKLTCMLWPSREILQEKYCE